MKRARSRLALTHLQKRSHRDFPAMVRIMMPVDANRLAGSRKLGIALPTRGPNHEAHHVVARVSPSLSSVGRGHPRRRDRRLDGSDERQKSRVKESKETPAVLSGKSLSKAPARTSWSPRALGANSFHQGVPARDWPVSHASRFKPWLRTPRVSTF